MFVANRSLVAFIAAVGLLLAACGAEGDAATTEAKLAEMELDPSDQILFNYGAVEVGEAKSQIVAVINTGNKTLRIDDVYLEYDPVNSDLETSPETYAFQIEFNDGEAAPFRVAGKADPEAGVPLTFFFKVTVKNLGDDLERNGYVVLDSNDSDTPSYRLPIQALSGVPRLRVTPDLVDFQRVGAAEVMPRELIVRNSGSSELIVDSFIFIGSESFTMKHGSLEVQPSAATQDQTPFGEPISLLGDESTTIELVFAPESDHPANATLVLFSNDPSDEDGTVIELLGNQELPCISVLPTKVDFGAVMPGGIQEMPVEIKSCGTNKLHVTKLELLDDESGYYAIDATSFFEACVAEGTIEPPAGLAELSEERPCALDPNTTAQLLVRYAPSMESPLGSDGYPIADAATLLISNDSFEDELEIEVKGVCSEIISPTAIIECEEGNEVIPQTVLHLHGDQSYSPNGEIVSYSWTVEQPQGSVSYFVPSPTFPNPILEANIAGPYVFRLEVTDSAGVKSAYPAVYEIMVIPDEAIHIELIWDTPNDPDPTDEGPAAGTDMDLHFAHAYASGPDIDGDGTPDPWFNVPFDVFWFNKNPDWGSFDPSIDDDPGLDRDDTDGGGPENVNLNIPEGAHDAPFTYRVGVHYWDDKNFGESFATVRVYIYSSLVFEVPEIKMLNHDLWEVCSVEWPSTIVQLILDQNGGYKITPNYQNPIGDSN
jgi:hypothetical protein